MSEYIPDKWVMISIPYGDTVIYKVFACWYGGYGGSDSWKLNSGVVSITQEGSVYSFIGSSGSVYKCHKDCYGTNGYGNSVLCNMIKVAGEQGLEIQILPEETNFMELAYG